MFAPVYAAAFARGIAHDALDRTPLHIVGWSLTGGPTARDGEPETDSEMIDAWYEREQARVDGRLDEFYRPDPVTTGWAAPVGVAA